MIRGNKPWRSKRLLRFCHDEMKPALCCVCGDAPWTMLHHFGDDGGMSMKPSDNEVARVCVKCHGRYDLKRHALIRKQSFEYFSVLESFQNDALKLNRAYMEMLEGAKGMSLPPDRCFECDYSEGNAACLARVPHAEPPNDCALDELNMWLATEGPGLGPDEQRDYLLGWANRRAANVIGFLVEPMREIAGKTDQDSARFVARRALKIACLEEVKDA